MNYSVSHHLREPGVKQKDGVMLTRNVPLKLAVPGLQVVNKINYIFGSFWIEIPTKMTLSTEVGFGACFILEIKSQRVTTYHVYDK